MGARILIVGVGNPLARDEGLGPRAIERLRARGLPEGVEAIDAGTDFLAILPELTHAARVIVIDAMQAGGRPGTVYRMTLGELEARAQEAEWRSGHDLSLVTSAQLAEATGIPLPPTVVYGVEPGEVALGEGLTPAVRGAIDRLLDAVLQEVATAP